MVWEKLCLENSGTTESIYTGVEDLEIASWRTMWARSWRMGKMWLRRNGNRMPSAGKPWAVPLWSLPLGHLPTSLGLKLVCPVPRPRLRECLLLRAHQAPDAQTGMKTQLWGGGEGNEMWRWKVVSLLLIPPRPPSKDFLILTLFWSKQVNISCQFVFKI